MTGHIGNEKLVKRVENVAYVNILPKIIHDVAKACGRCIQSKILHKENEEFPVQEMPIPDGPGERWHIDLWGPYKDGEKAYYVIGAIDAYTKWIIARPIADKKATTAFKFLVEELIFRFGVPKEL